MVCFQELFRACRFRVLFYVMLQLFSSETVCEVALSVLQCWHREQQGRELVMRQIELLGTDA